MCGDADLVDDDRVCFVDGGNESTSPHVFVGDHQRRTVGGEVIFEFLYDKFFHFSQVATIDADGRPKMTTSGQLSEVKWMRLPRTATDFNNIYAGDTALKSYVEDGWWVC